MGRQALTTLELTVKASGAVAKYRCVGFDGAQATVAGQKVLGTAMYDAADGDELPVGADDTVLAIAGAAVAVGDTLIADANGAVIPDNGTAGNYLWADALEAAAAGDIFEVFPRR